MTKEEILEVIPNLGVFDFERTSDATNQYNCIAWANGENHRKWQSTFIPAPGFYWPPTAVPGDSIEALESAYAAHGFSPCTDDKLEDGIEKIALYVDSKNEWTHASRQLPNGNWTSKLGRSIDIEHKTQYCVECDEYGTVKKYMQRPRGTAVAIT